MKDMNQSSQFGQGATGTSSSGRNPQAKRSTTKLEIGKTLLKILREGK